MVVRRRIVSVGPSGQGGARTHGGMLVADGAMLLQGTCDSIGRRLEQAQDHLHDGPDDSAGQDDRGFDDRDDQADQADRWTHRSAKAFPKSSHRRGETREFGVFEQGDRLVGDEAVAKDLSRGGTGGDDPCRLSGRGPRLPGPGHRRRSPLRHSSEQQSASIPARSELDQWDVECGSRCDVGRRWRRVFGGGGVWTGGRRVARHVEVPGTVVPSVFPGRGSRPSHPLQVGRGMFGLRREDFGSLASTAAVFVRVMLPEQNPIGREVERS